MSENVEVFSTRVRKATRKIHSISDALVNAKFAISLGDETVWGGGLFVFYHIFGFLEDAKERLNMPDLNKLFVHKIMYRKKAFEEDLQHYLGSDWQTNPRAPALDNYLEHLRGLEREQPRLLAAYVYHLYLGLLSGGQILARKRSVFGGNRSKESYVDKVTDFSEVDIAGLKLDMRRAMNEVAEDMTEEEREAFIEESGQVFLMNNLIVNSVGGQTRVLKSMLYQVSAVALVVAAVVIAYKTLK